MHSFASRPAGWSDRLDTLLTRLRRRAVEFPQSPYLNETSCVIVDVQMPGMTGVELQDVLNAQDCSVPMIFITAFPKNIRSRAMRAGALCFPSKPFDATALIAAIGAALKRFERCAVVPQIVLGFRAPLAFADPE
jgi:FixJ family two-component response regulator